MTLKGQSQGHSDFKGWLISCKGAELGPVLLLTINTKPYMASLITSSLWTLSDLERSKSRSFRVSVTVYLYCIHVDLPAGYYHENLNVTNESLLAAGFSAVPAVFLVNLGDHSVLFGGQYP